MNTPASEPDLQTRAKPSCKISGLRWDEGFRQWQICVAILLLSGVAATALAQPKEIFLVRHAERAAISGRVPADTGLSPEGKTRAEHLAQRLKEAGIRAIFTSEYKRTRETAAPLARSLRIQPEIVAAGDLRSLLSKINATSGNVLVVGHSNTLPQIIAALGVRSKVGISESDYDNLFIVRTGKTPQLTWQHYR